MSFRAYFRPWASRFSHFSEPVGKQVFSVIAANASLRPPGIGKSLFLRKNESRGVPLMSAYADQRVFSLETMGQAAMMALSSLEANDGAPRATAE
jgi:hypothetical protein